MKIICISGHAQNGKDCVATYLKESLEDRGYRILIAHYADLLKYVCREFFDWNGKKDEMGRSILQYVGTDVVRANAPNYWVDFILGILELFPNEWDYVLIPDNRFPGEIEGLKSAGYDAPHIRVVRPNFQSPLTEEQQKHPSETALDSYPYDDMLINDGSLDDLRKKVFMLAESIIKNGKYGRGD